MINLSNLEDKSVGSSAVEWSATEDIGVEKIGAYDYRICFDREKFCVEDELIDSIESHLLVSGNLYVGLDTRMIYAGILLLSFNSVKFFKNREDIHAMIEYVVEAITATATNTVVPLV